MNNFAMTQHVIGVFKEEILGWKRDGSSYVVNVSALKARLYEGFDRNEVDAYLRTYPQSHPVRDNSVYDRDYLIHHICELVHSGCFFEATPISELVQEESFMKGYPTCIIYNAFKPLCKGTIASLAGHPSTRIIECQHYEYKSGYGGLINSVAVGILDTAGGTYIGFVATEEFTKPATRFDKSITLCELQWNDIALIASDTYPPTYFNALAKRVNEHADKFTIEIPKLLNCRLLNLQKFDAVHQFYYKGEVYYLEDLDDLEAFIANEFPMMKIIEHMEEEDGRDMLIIQNSKSDNDFDFLTFYNSEDRKGLFSCYYEDGGSLKPFIKLLNVIGMEATL